MVVVIKANMLQNLRMIGIIYDYIMSKLFLDASIRIFVILKKSVSV